MNDDLPDAVNRDGGESDVVAERSGAGTPKAPRPVPADWPDTDTNPAIPTPEIIAPGTETGTEPESEDEAGAEPESDAASGAEAEATADAERRADTGEEAGDGGEKEVRPEAGPTG
ncbi:hypothetical protein ACIBO2_41795 [Nonomuraea sp. NPDC050022]|uniref:hypothetical protein n=1 Tax=unclassified Nonomuraea TaxID=2593643 RepID=UPI0033E1100C